jgi:hypothetical protein
VDVVADTVLAAQFGHARGNGLHLRRILRLGHEHELASRLDELRRRGLTVVGICPSSVVASKAAASGWDYPGMLADIAEQMLQRERAVLLFPNATRESQGDALRNNDLPVIGQVAGRILDGGMSQDRLAVVEHDLNAASIKRLVDRCDAALVSRFHAMIAALVARVPVVVLGWSHKYAEVMDDFGLADSVFDHAGADRDTLTGSLEACLSERSEISSRVTERLPVVAAASERQFEYLLDLLESSSARG